MGQQSSSQDREKEKELMQRHKIDKRELETLRKLFRERCGGKHKALTKTKFREVYDELFPGKSTGYADEMFRLFDMDGNGEVDFVEFVRNICMCDSDDIEEKIEVAFALYDKDNSKTISQTEVRNILEVSYFKFFSWNLFRFFFFPWNEHAIDNKSVHRVNDKSFDTWKLQNLFINMT